MNNPSLAVAAVAAAAAANPDILGAGLIDSPAFKFVNGTNFSTSFTSTLAPSSTNPISTSSSSSTHQNTNDFIGIAGGIHSEKRGEGVLENSVSKRPPLPPNKRRKAEKGESSTATHNRFTNSSDGAMHQTSPLTLLPSLTMRSASPNSISIASALSLLSGGPAFPTPPGVSAGSVTPGGPSSFRLLAPSVSQQSLSQQVVQDINKYQLKDFVNTSTPISIQTQIHALTQDTTSEEDCGSNPSEASPTSSEGGIPGEDEMSKKEMDPISKEFVANSFSVGHETCF